MGAVSDFASTVTQIDGIVLKIPTTSPESDGTLSWDSTTMVVVEVSAGGLTGLGFTYAATAARDVIDELLSPVVCRLCPMDIEHCWHSMVKAVRNAGRPGVCSYAIAAVDIALWDLKAKLLGVSLVDLFSSLRESVPVYGSGGFTSYDDEQLSRQLEGWVGEGIKQVKIKVGRDPEDDPRRVALARKVIGPDAGLFVDANGAYTTKQALRLAEEFAEKSNVSWLEEPRPSSDLRGLRYLSDRLPAGLEVTAGEYGCTPGYFRHMLEAQSVDCLQADATRCGGFTGFLKVAALCEAYDMPLSAHCAPQLHAHVGLAASPLRHIEYFHDHVHIADLVLEGQLHPIGGRLYPESGRLGHGLQLKHSSAERFRIA